MSCALYISISTRPRSRSDARPHAGRGKPRLPRRVVLTDHLDQPTDPARVETGRLTGPCTAADLAVAADIPGPGLLSAQPGNRLRHDISAAQEHKPRAAERAFQQPSVVPGQVRENPPQLDNQLSEGPPHELRPEHAVPGPARRQRRPQVVRVIETALSRARNPPPLSPQRLVRLTEVRLRTASDPRGLQQPEQQRAAGPRSTANEVRIESPRNAHRDRHGHNVRPPDTARNATTPAGRMREMTTSPHRGPGVRALQMTTRLRRNDTLTGSLQAWPDRSARSCHDPLAGPIPAKREAA